MNRRTMLAIAVLVLGGAAFGWFALRGRAPRFELHPVGPYAVGLRNTPAPPRTGENALTILVEDERARPVHAARVEVRVSMPAMGAMPYMESRGRVSETAPGVYRVAYGLAMPGEWDVTLRVQTPGAGSAEGRWRLSTHLRELAFAGGEAEGAAAARTADSSAVPGTIVLDAARRQAIGVRTARVELRNLIVPVRARGTVAFDETARAVISLRYPGWVRTMVADFTGMAVRRGDPLFTVESPEIVAAEQEYLTALGFARADSAAHVVAFGGGPGGGAASTGATFSLADAARQRLLSWGLTLDQVRTIERTGRPLTTLVVRAPVGGVVVEKSIVAGSPFTTGQVLMSIAAVDPIWIEARLYETDLPLVRTGMPARVTSPYAPGGARSGRVAFVGPALEGDTRTGVARIELANPGGALRPGMFVDVTLEAALGRRLVVPEGAVVATGTRQIVFVDRGGGRLEPREVTIGPRTGEWIVIERGLAAGETVVASGNFLVAADSRLKSALGKW